MSEYLYECRYCGKHWGGMYRVHDPVCSKCGSEGDYYVKTSRVDRSDIFGYEVEEKKLGEKQGYPVHRPDSD